MHDDQRLLVSFVTFCKMVFGSGLEGAIYGYAFV